MTKSRWLSVVFVALATTAFYVQSFAATRSIVLELSFANGATPQLRIADGQTGTVDLPHVGKFGFVPKVQNDGNGMVAVEIFKLDSTPHTRLTRVEAVTGGDRIDTDTTPRIGVRIVRVVEP